MTSTQTTGAPFFQPAEASGLRVYSGNDALLTSQDGLGSLGNTALLMEIWASAQARDQRLAERSPGLAESRAELATRLREVEHDPVAWPRIRVHNSSQEALGAAVRVFELLVEGGDGV